MDARHHREKVDREYYSNTKERRDRRGRDIARVSKDGSRREMQQESRKTSTQRHVKPEPILKKTPTMQLSADNDYVSNWLDQAYMEEIVPKPQPSSRSDYQYQARPPHGRFAPQYQDTDEAQPPPRKSKRKHNSSSDSSLLQEPEMPKSSADVTKNRRRHPEAALATSPQSKRQRTDHYVSGMTREPDESAPSNEVFEKRPRHKTREDRYDSKKQDKNPKKRDEEEPRRTKKESRGGRRKAARKAREDLIQNFPSKSIGQDRLTMRPSSGLGLFKNGRASSPAKRRGVPDLAFSEMDFLQHSRPPHVGKEIKNRYKSREQEKRKALRTLDEISTFFKPTRTPFQQVQANQQHSAQRERTPIFVPDREATSKNEICFQSVESSDKHYLDFEGNRQSRKQGRRAHGIPSAQKRSDNVVDSTSLLSDRATSYLSWSETVCSPSGISMLVDRHQHSPTPDSIKRSLDDTRILENTGIRTWDTSRESVGFSPPRPSDHRPRVSRKEYQERSFGNNEHAETAGKFPPTESTSSTSSESPTSESEDEDVDEQDQSHKRISTRRSHTDAENEFTRPNTLRLLDDDRPGRNIVIKPFDPNAGWHERSNSAPNSNAEEHKDRRTSINREELAKRARINRPATTLPLVRKEGLKPERRGLQAEQSQSATTSITHEQLQEKTLQETRETDKHSRSKSDDYPHPTTDSTRIDQPSDFEETHHHPISAVATSIPYPIPPSSGIGSQRSYDWFSGRDFNHPPPQAAALVNNPGLLSTRYEVSHLSLPARGYGSNTFHLGAFYRTRLDPIPEEDPLYSRQLQHRNLYDDALGYPMVDFADNSGWRRTDFTASIHQAYRAEHDQNSEDLANYDIDRILPEEDFEFEGNVSEFDNQIGIAHLVSGSGKVEDEVKLEAPEELSGQYQEEVDYHGEDAAGGFEATEPTFHYHRDLEEDPGYLEGFWRN